MRLLRDERAQAMVETAIAFPVQIVITLAIMQFCLIAGAKQVINYAAHAAARAVLVFPDPDYDRAFRLERAHRAASMVVSPIAGSDVVPGVAAPIFIPGRGDLPRSHQAQLKTEVEILNDVDDGDRKVAVRVTHKLQLIIPFVEATPFNDWHLLWGRIEKLGPDRVVHKVITQTVALPQPWDGDLAGVTDLGHEIIPDLRSPED